MCFEYNILCKLDHPNIVKAFAFNPLVNTLYMQYAGSMSLKDYVRTKRMHDMSVYHIFEQLVDAIEHIHKRGVAHRDIKLENVQIDPNEQFVQLLDFGLATMNVRSDTVCGSLHYAAPELLSGNIYFSKYVDLWSLGILLFAMTFQCYPFDCANMRNADYFDFATNRDVFMEPFVANMTHRDNLHIGVRTNIDSLLKLKPHTRRAVVLNEEKVACDYCVATAEKRETQMDPTSSSETIDMWV